jgi:hypothetical protein
VAILYGSGGSIRVGTKQVGEVLTWSIEQSGGSEIDWSGSLTASWNGRPELGRATLDLRDNGGANWTGDVTITDVPFRVSADRKAEIGFQGAGPLGRS